jgi:hypothetical protein
MKSAGAVSGVVIYCSTLTIGCGTRRDESWRCEGQSAKLPGRAPCSKLRNLTNQRLYTPTPLQLRILSFNTLTPLSVDETWSSLGHRHSGVLFDLPLLARLGPELAVKTGNRVGGDSMQADMVPRKLAANFHGMLHFV